MFEHKRSPMNRSTTNLATRQPSPRAGQISFEIIVLACVMFLLGTLLLVGVDSQRPAQASKAGEPAQEVREFATLHSTSGNLAIRYDNRCVVWNPHTDGADLLWLPPSTHRLTVIASSPAAPYLVVGWADGVLSQIDGETQNPRWETMVHGGEPTLSEYSHDGSMILIGSSNGKIMLLESEDGATRWSHRPITSPQMAMAFSPDDKHIFVAQGTVIAILDSRTGEQIDQIEGISGRPSRIRTSPDGRYLAVSTFDGFLDLFDLSTREKQFSTHFSKLAILSLVFSPDHKRLYFSTQDGRIAAVNLEDNYSVLGIGRHQKTVATMALLDGDLVTGSFDGEIRVWPGIQEAELAHGKQAFHVSRTLSPNAHARR